MENLMMDLGSEPPELERLLDDMLAFNLRWLGKWTRLEYDGLHFADDWGGQHRLMIKPEKWRRLFKPRYAEMFRMAREAGMDVWYHSDGRINDVIGDLIEIGARVINCQVAVVGHDWIAANARGKVAFRTDIDRQWVMPFGTTAQVKEEVQRVFEDLRHHSRRHRSLRRSGTGCPPGEYPRHVCGLPAIRRLLKTEKRA
jgi:uroporphyrinogen-III decarboxylase